MFKFVSTVVKVPSLTSNASRSAIRTVQFTPNRLFATETAATKNIFIGNLPWETSESDIQTLFGPYGAVTSVKIMRDAQTGRPRGFGFITIQGVKAATAITDLDGKEFKGRNLRVNEALKKPERTPYEPRRQNRSEKQDDSDS